MNDQLSLGISARNMPKRRNAEQGMLAALDGYVVADVMYAIQRLVLAHQEFTADDLELKPSTRSALRTRRGTLGACFQHAARSGMIEAIGYAPAKHELANGRVLRVWRGK